ncbi:MAG: uroporphyrinogen decarboxylase family protein [Pseudomonadota bacterium]
MNKDEMTPYERMMGVLNGEPVDRVPVAPIVREWCARQAGFTFSGLMNSASMHAFSQYYCAKTYGLDLLWDFYGIHAEAEAMGSVLKVPDDMPCSVERPAIQDYDEDLPKIKLLNPYKDGHLPIVLEGIRQLKELAGERYAVLGYLQGPFRLASMLRGFEPFLKDCIKTDSHLEEFLEFCTDALIVYGTAVIQAGSDFIFIGDPTSSGDAISRKMWMEYGFPYTRRLVKALKANRVKVLMHICGDTSDRLDTFVETGIDAMSVDEKVDLAYAREVMGDDVCLWGNVSPTKTLFMGTPEAVDAEARACIEKGRGKKGNFVLCSGCNVPAEVPPENMKALVNAAHKYGGGDVHETSS